MKNLLSLLLLSIILTGCTTLNPVTNQEEFSKEKTQALKAAVQGPVTSALTIAFIKNPSETNIQTYFRSVGGVFCDIKQTTNFNPSSVVLRINDIALPKIKDGDLRIVVTSVKDSLIALYTVFYAQKINVPAVESSYLYNISDVICGSVDTALKNAGKPGIE